MNKFDLLKEEILKDFPNHKSLPLVIRLKIFLSSGDGEYTRTIQEAHGCYSQSAITVWIDNKEYFKRWGKL